jgi:hypothetical protein
MRPKPTLWMMGLGLVGPGCSLCGVAVETVAYKTRECIQDCEERSRNGKWSEAAWCDVRRTYPETTFSDSFACGFRSGYADYLYAGEQGMPPALPPRQYRSLAYQTPAGYRSIEEWFAGYRYGVQVARSDGYRELITGPTSLPGPQLTAAPPSVLVPEPGAEQLHYPRQAPAPVLRPRLPSPGTVREPELGRLPEPAQIHLAAPQSESDPVGAATKAQAEELDSIGELPAAAASADSAPANLAGTKPPFAASALGAPSLAPQDQKPAPQRTAE